MNNPPLPAIHSRFLLETAHFKAAVERAYPNVDTRPLNHFYGLFQAQYVARFLRPATRTAPRPGTQGPPTPIFRNYSSVSFTPNPATGGVTAKLVNRQFTVTPHNRGPQSQSTFAPTTTAQFGSSANEFSSRGIPTYRSRRQVSIGVQAGPGTILPTPPTSTQVPPGGKLYRCTYEACQMKSNYPHSVIQHVRRLHFRLPVTIKAQKEQGRLEEVDAKTYVSRNE